ncbi:MAG: S41 family peptidase [Candidatus Muirbacterium halophilum]|nr:S41 family peptidase [Candidatus Muirbacterium halophilum]MCK9474917.1 S41 family peptidase [Candidatus Muirbacterium halophilum]
MKKKSILTGMLILLVFIFSQGASIPFTYIKKASMVDRVLKIIQDNFVGVSDTYEVNDTKMIYGAIEGMLKTLDDPYTRFMEPTNYKEMQEETTGTFAGVGIIITNKDDYLMVVSPIEGTPAWKAGVQPGDIIYKIDDEPSAHMHTIDATKKIKGPIGTIVKLTILRKAKDGKEKYIDMDIKRDNINVSTISQSGVIRNHIGYVRINNFGERTGTEFKEEIEKLRKNASIDCLIVDLRSNPGGLLNTAVETASVLLPKGKTVVSIKGRNNEEVSYPVYQDGIIDLPLVILVNKGSASGSEIVAGAIKDLKRGLLVGSNTFGKGVVQTVIPLDDGAAIAVTTAKYYTPSGICIHGDGIAPDIAVDMPEVSEELLKDIDEDRVKNYEKEQKKIFEREKGEVIKIEIGKYDNQMKAAADILEGAELLNSIYTK